MIKTLLVAGAASAGPCSTEIDTLQRPLSSTDAGQAGEYGTSAAPIEAEASLERARQFDQAGDEAACMEEIAKVTTRLGAQ